MRGAWLHAMVGSQRLPGVVLRAIEHSTELFCGKKERKCTRVVVIDSAIETPISRQDLLCRVPCSSHGLQKTDCALLDACKAYQGQ